MAGMVLTGLGVVHKAGRCRHGWDVLTGLDGVAGACRC